MARFFSRLFCIIILSVLTSYPLGAQASVPFMKKGFYVVHRHQQQALKQQVSYLPKPIMKASPAASSQFLRLQKIELSQTAHQQITSLVRKSLDNSSNVEESTQDSESVSLGMNGVPVFNQGAWGSCVTFSVTAGLDAYYQLAGSDRISQLCDLALGLSLQTSGPDGGWNGASAGDVLGQISRYGFLTEAYQKAHGCGGLTHYPLYEDSHGSSMSPSRFIAAPSDRRLTSSQWRELGVLVMTDRELEERMTHPLRALENVKAALRRGHRVSIGIILDPDIGDVGAVGSYHGYDDVWMLTDAVSEGLDNEDLLGAHEVLVTGFDDTCIKPSVDGSPQEVCGYLTVRNSWSALAGDKGDYYISYDYFNALANEAYEIG